MDTTYDGPVVVTGWKVGDRTIRLARPADPDRLLDDPDVLAWNRRDDYMPYWAYLWPGATLLAKAVDDEPWREGTSAIEIGCGLGLAGLVALSKGLRVQFTDYDEAPLRFVARSVRENGFESRSHAIARLDWREPTGERFPVILGSDVLYERRLVPLVADLLAAMLEPGGLALIADPNRASAEGLAGALARRGLAWDAGERQAESPEHGPIRGTIYRIRRVEDTA